MMTIEEIRAALADRNLIKVAERTGIGYQTLRRIYSGTTDPRATTIEQLTKYLSNPQTFSADKE